MKTKSALIWAVVFTLSAIQSSYAEPHLKSVKIAVTNPSDQNRPAENIVLSVAELRKIAPDIYIGSHIVTDNDASTVAEEEAVLHERALHTRTEDIAGA